MSHVLLGLCKCDGDAPARRYLESYAQVPSAALTSNQNPEVSLDMGSSSLVSADTAHIPGLGSKASGRKGRNADDVESSYKTLYEERVNPFADFNRYGCVFATSSVFRMLRPVPRREKMKRYGNLSAAEKITLSSTQLFLSSKFARTFVFFYSVGLHCLVFATLYHFTNVVHH